MANPMGTAEAIYQHFGLPLSGAAADAMRILTAASPAGGGPPGGGPAHRYSLEAFGLTGEDVDERFGPIPSKR